MTDPQVIVNLGTGGSDLNGQNGSTSSADSNDALFLDWPGDNAGNYVYLPGVSGNYLSVPDEAALDITGDIDIRVQVAMDDWTPSVSIDFIEKYTTTGDQRSWRFYLHTSGTLRFTWSTDGTSGAATNVVSTTQPVVSDGDALWVRVTFDVDNGSSGNDAKFYTSTDGSSWSQLGSTVTTAGTTSIYSSTAELQIGGFITGYAAGSFYRAQVLDGIDGTTVLDVDTSVITSGADTSFTAATGQTVTVNRSTSGRKSVAVVSPVWLFGTDDYMEVADNALLDFDADDSFTVLAVMRQWATPTNFGMYVHKRDGTDAGYLLSSSGTTLRALASVSGGAVTDSRNGLSFSAGNLVTFAGVIDRAAQTIEPFTNGVTNGTDDISSVGSPANTLPLRLGRRAEGSAYQDFELLGVAVFRRALTATELAAITTYYQNKVA